MSGLLFVVGAVAAVAGAVMIGFGIPVNEFSFGNTLIVSGVTAVAGGLIVMALGVVVAQLQRIAEALTARTPIRSSRPLDMFDNGGSRAPAPARVPFPPKPKADSATREPLSPEPRLGPMSTMNPMSPAEQPIAEDLAHSFAPSLRNPEESSLTVEDDVSLSPRHPMTGPAPQPAADHDEPEQRSKSLFDNHTSEMTEERHEPTLDAGWRPGARSSSERKHTAYFDAMWPAEPKDTKPANADIDLKTYDAPVQDAEPELPEPKVEELQGVAILKSGVVDGMGYTLYVDGSIEAELPQGTLRFASINELRSHLEKNA